MPQLGRESEASSSSSACRCQQKVSLKRSNISHTPVCYSQRKSRSCPDWIRSHPFSCLPVLPLQTENCLLLFQSVLQPGILFNATCPLCWSWDCHCLRDAVNPRHLKCVTGCCPHTYTPCSWVFALMFSTCLLVDRFLEVSLT